MYETLVTAAPGIGGVVIVVTLAFKSFNAMLKMQNDIQEKQLVAFVESLAKFDEIVVEFRKSVGVAVEDCHKHHMLAGEAYRDFTREMMQAQQAFIDRMQDRQESHADRVNVRLDEQLSKSHTLGVSLQVAIQGQTTTQAAANSCIGACSKLIERMYVLIEKPGASVGA